MANRLNIGLEQSWETLDQAINYFLNLVLDLQAAKRFPELPTDLFISYEGVELDDAQQDNLQLVLTNL